MANKKAILEQLADYFAKKGMMMTPSEYKSQEDAPIRYMAAKRPFGSWARMQSMLKVNFPDQWAKATEEVVVEKPKPTPKKVAKAAPKKAEK